MASWELTVLAAYYTVLLVLAVYGVHRAHLTWIYFRSRSNKLLPKREFETLPKVAIQLPIFNEATVVERLIDAACALDYPRDRLEIQVLDDSTDETTAIAEKKVQDKQREGFLIRHIRRGDRAGFKAGALAAGLRATDAEFLAVFDADFVPPPGFVKALIHHFTDDKVGMVQARWGHLNRRFSICTRVQAILLDGHFVIEHTARNRSGRFFNFNGTAGIWRRAAILEAGGWQHDTLTEDLDLSYRAQIAGWQFIYRPDVVCPAELPIEMNAFKSQQRRWAKGSIQTCKKLIARLWKSPVPLRAKIEGSFHLTNNFSYLLMMVMFLLLLPAFLARLKVGTVAGWVFDMSLFMAATSSLFAFYVASQREGNEGETLGKTLLYFPAVLALGIGLSVSNCAAVLEVLRGKVTEFVRTPKYGVGAAKQRDSAFRYVGGKNKLAVIELALALHFTLILSIAFSRNCQLAGTFFTLFAAGFYWVGLASLFPARGVVEPPAPPPSSEETDEARQAIHSNTGAY
jgi:cellulose synthase/poly-beta-1,6-N-acetylglucosamine synthase-like glycosyltransferase